MANREANLLIRIKEAGSEALDRIRDRFGAIKNAILAVYGVVGGLVAASIKAYADEESAVNSLNQALVQQGIYSKDLSDRYRQLAKEMQGKSIYADEEIIQAQASMQMYLGQTKVSEKLMQAVLDLATAKKMNLASAAEMVAKSIGTNTNALARQGIQLPENIDKNQKLAYITTQLTAKFGGQAEAATLGAGAFTVLKNQAGELLETIGAGVTPAIVETIRYFSEMTKNVNESSAQIGAFTQIAIFLAKAIIYISSVLTETVNGLGAFAASIGEALAALNNLAFSRAWEILKQNNASANAELEESRRQRNEALARLDNAYQAQQQAAIAKEQQNLKDSKARIQEIEAEAAMTKTVMSDQKMSEEQQKQLDHFLRMQQGRTMATEQELSELRIKIAIEKNEQDMARLAEIDALIAFHATKEQALALHEEKNLILKKYYDAEKTKLDKKKADEDKAAADKKAKDEFERADAREKFDLIMKKKEVQRGMETLSYLTQMQDSKHKEMVAIGKAAAIAQIGIDTAKAVMGVWGWAAGIPIVGPAIALGLSAAIIGYGAEQVSRVNSSKMAEGGIVKARPGGMLATIGEGGRDEAVIPLDENGMIPGTGSGITLIVYGGLLGDDRSARELAMALDKELLKLRQSNSSVAFDSGSV